MLTLSEIRFKREVADGLKAEAADASRSLDERYERNLAAVLEERDLYYAVLRSIRDGATGNPQYARELCLAAGIL